MPHASPRTRPLETTRCVIFLGGCRHVGASGASGRGYNARGFLHWAVGWRGRRVCGAGSLRPHQRAGLSCGRGACASDAVGRRCARACALPGAARIGLRSLRCGRSELEPFNTLFFNPKITPCFFSPNLPLFSCSSRERTLFCLFFRSTLSNFFILSPSLFLIACGRTIAFLFRPAVPSDWRFGSVQPRSQPVGFLHELGGESKPGLRVGFSGILPRAFSSSLFGWLPFFKPVSPSEACGLRARLVQGSPRCYLVSE